MTTKKAILIFALLIAGSANAESREGRCNQAVKLAEATLQCRQAGIPEGVVLEYLRSRGIYSGLPVRVVKAAYDAPADVRPWMLRGAVFGDCMEHGE